MGEKPQNIKHRHISLGVLAHVDAGKTTLSEGLLFKCGRIRKIGRVDHKDAYLDTGAALAKLDSFTPCQGPHY